MSTTMKFKAKVGQLDDASKYLTSCITTTYTWQFLCPPLIGAFLILLVSGISYSIHIDTTRWPVGCSPQQPTSQLISFASTFFSFPTIACQSHKSLYLVGRTV